MAKRKRAAFGDESAWSDATRDEIERHIRSFLAVCARAGQDNAAPDERWLAEHLQAIRDNNGRSYARRYARNVGHHLRRCKAKPLIDGKLVRAVLRAPDGIDPLAIDLDDANLPFSLGRAQIFSDDAFRSTTYQHYTYSAKKWVARCTDLGIDPAHPPLEALEQYFEELAQVSAYSTVINYRSALKYYFRKCNADDLTRAPEIERILEGLERAKPQKRVYATTADVRRAMLASFEDEGVGVRDRVILLLTAFTRMSCERMAFLRIEQCRLSSDGVEIVSLGKGQPIFIGAHEDRDLNIVYWLGRLLEMLPPSGVLFRSVHVRRMRFGETGLAPNRINRIVADAARKAGEGPDDMAARLRLLFEAETHGRESSIILAFQNNRKSVPNDRSENTRHQKMKSRGIGRSPSPAALL
jgi:integrase